MLQLGSYAKYYHLVYVDWVIRGLIERILFIHSSSPWF